MQIILKRENESESERERKREKEREREKEKERKREKESENRVHTLTIGRRYLIDTMSPIADDDVSPLSLWV